MEGYFNAPHVDEAVELADVGRKGAADLEKGIENVRNYFFKAYEFKRKIPQRIK